MKENAEVKVNKISGELKGIICTLIAGAFWGIGGTCAQYVMGETGATAVFLIPFRLFTAGLVTLAYLYAKRGKSVFTIWKKPDRAIFLFIYGAIGIGMAQFSYFATIQHSNAGVATVMGYLAPALILIYVCAKSKRKPKFTEVLAILLTLAGIFLLATHGNVSSFAISPTAFMWGMINGCSVAVYTLMPGLLKEKFDTSVILAWGMIVGGLMYAPFIALQEGPVTFGVMPLIIFILFVVIGASIVSFNMYFKGIAELGPSKASLLSCDEPIIAVILTTVWLDTQFTVMDILGMLITVAGVITITLTKGTNT